MNWTNFGHFYAALAGFSIGCWTVLLYYFIREVFEIRGREVWRLPAGLASGVLGLSAYGVAASAALNDPKAHIPAWRFTLYCSGLVLANVGLLLFSQHFRRYGIITRQPRPSSRYER